MSGKYDKAQPPPPGARLDKWKDRLAAIDNDRNWRILAAVLGYPYGFLQSVQGRW